MSKAKDSRHRYGLAAVFSLNTFLIVVVLLVAVTAVAWISVTQGLISAAFWQNPLVITAIAAVVCSFLSSAILVMANGLVFQPIRDMNRALAKLADGSFDTRIEVGDTLQIREIEDFAREFNVTAAKLGQVEELRAGFVDDFSHEFKTPIASINGFADLLAQDDISEDERREYASVIAEESARLAQLSDSLLALRRVESQSELGPTAVFDIAEQLRQRMVIAQQAYEEKGIVFDARLKEAQYLGDEALLERVWANLLDNAAKFSEPGGRVRVYCRKAQGQVIVRICNGGAIIPPAALDRVFDRFYQADESHASRGNGLGLPLVKRVVDLHGGSISVTSNESETCFEVRL